MPTERVLIIDDDRQWWHTLSSYLVSEKYETCYAGTCRQAEDTLRRMHPDVVVLDHSLPDGNALTVLPTIKSFDSTIPVIILTAYGSIDLAVEAIKCGAIQFLTKPVELSALCAMIEKAVEVRRSRQRQVVDRELGEKRGPCPFVGTSTAIKKLEEVAAKVIGVDSPVLIQGETGSGKGVLAKWIHRQGTRSKEAFVDLNCGGLSRDLLETELFGHEKGAFTGAVQRKLGLLEVAHKGTVFLDEIGDVDLQVQPKLLKVLEEKQFRRLGDNSDRRVDIRLIAATHQDVVSMIEAQRFRSDLYFRISTVPLVVPALRERVEDIPVLAEHLLRQLSADLALGEVTLLPGAATALQAYSWPGNIRELRNVLERAVLLRTSDQLGEKDLHFDLRVQPQNPSNRLRTLEEIEREYIAEVLRREGGRVSAAAITLGIARSSLYQKMKEYGLSRTTAYAVQ